MALYSDYNTIIPDCVKIGNVDMADWVCFAYRTLRRAGWNGPELAGAAKATKLGLRKGQ